MAEHRAKTALMSAPKGLPPSWTGLFLRMFSILLGLSRSDDPE